MSAGAPAPGPSRGAGLCTLPLAAGLCGAHPCTLAAQRGLAPENYEEEKGSKRGTETCYPGQGSREEGTAVHARNSASAPARQALAGRAECLARGARSHLEPAPVRERHAQPGSLPRLSLHTSAGAERAGSGLGQPQRGALIAQQRAGDSVSAEGTGAEAEEAPETERGLLAHCHLSRAAAAAWSLRPQPPPPSHPSPLPPSPSSSRGPSLSRSPSLEASHRAGIIYVTSTPSPPPSLPAPAPPQAGAVRTKRALAAPGAAARASDVHKSRDTWQARPRRATVGLALLPRERPATPGRPVVPRCESQFAYTVLAQCTSEPLAGMLGGTGLPSGKARATAPTL